MDTSDTTDAKEEISYLPPSSPSAESDPFFSQDRSTAKAARIKARGVLSRLAGRWWQILLLWLVASAPIALLIYCSFRQPMKYPACCASNQHSLIFSARCERET